MIPWVIRSKLTKNERTFQVTPTGMNIGKKNCLRTSPVKEGNL